MSAAPVSLELQHAAVKQHCKILRMLAMLHSFPRWPNKLCVGDKLMLGGSATRRGVGTAGKEHRREAHSGSTTSESEDPGRVRKLRRSPRLRWALWPTGDTSSEPNRSC